MKTWSSWTRLAHAGAVVFAPSYNTDITTTEGFARTSDDLAGPVPAGPPYCYRAWGRPHQPFTVVGWSLGADLAMLGGLQGSGENTSTRCPGNLPRPDVVVGLSGCYYEFEGTPVTWFDDVSSWGNKSAHIYYGRRPRRRVPGLADGEVRHGASWSRATRLMSSGSTMPTTSPRSSTICAWNERQVITDDPAGDQAVKTILDAMTGAGANLAGDLTDWSALSPMPTHR